MTAVLPSSPSHAAPSSGAFAGSAGTALPANAPPSSAPGLSTAANSATLPDSRTVAHDVAPSRTSPTLWGLDPIQLHDYYWAARGVQVVRVGEPSSAVDGAELYLLTDRHTLTLFRVRSLLDTLSWLAPSVLITRIHEVRERPYEEHAITAPDGTLRRFVRSYAHSYAETTRAAFTTDPDIARAWMAMHDTRFPWRRMRQKVPQTRRRTASVRGHFYDRRSDAELRRFATDLVSSWPQPSASISRPRHHDTGVWVDPQATIPEGVSFVGEAWVGAGRALQPGDLVVGPAILWDDPKCRPVVETIQWQELEPSTIYTRPAALPQRSSLNRIAKRMFDMAFALVAIVLTLPLYPLVMLAILLEDGGPFFFAHKRETLGGREFPCLKFRSMRKDADKLKTELASRNQADGPQFFIENDPRLTRVGRIIRKTNIDELPQFINVLLGHMSIVGPRPSPRRENQFCPAWREARLSVRPGITGLWQVNRTRIRGSDFQEWIKHDIQYVESQSWLLDFQIIWKTILVVLRGITSS